VWRRGWIVAGIIAGAVIAAVLGGVLLSQSKADVKGEWGRALVTLSVAIIISGLLTFILSDYSQRQQQKADERSRREQQEADERSRHQRRLAADRERTLNWLRVLVGSNSRFQAARAILEAHKSAETYSNQVRDMAEVREDLRSLMEDLEAAMPEVAGDLGEIHEYIDGLGREFSKNYFRMSWKQRLHEERVKRYLDKDPLPDDPFEDPDDPWRLLQGDAFPNLADFLRHGDLYAQHYRAPYHDAQRLLRERLNQFGSQPDQAD
jgi:hypothetical protein